MNAIRIENIRDFMNDLLLTEKFDGYLVNELNLTTFCTFIIEGRRQKTFYDSDEPLGSENAPDTIYWKEIRPVVHSLIRGKKPPLSLTVSLTADIPQTKEFFKDRGISEDQSEGFRLHLNIRYRQGELSLISASTALNPLDIAADKEIRVLWDELVQNQFLK